MLSRSTVSSSVRARSFSFRVHRSWKLFVLLRCNNLLASLLVTCAEPLSSTYPKIMALFSQEGRKMGDYLDNRTEHACFRETTACQVHTGSEEETLAMPVEQHGVQIAGRGVLGSVTRRSSYCFSLHVSREMQFQWWGQPWGPHWMIQWLPLPPCVPSDGELGDEIAQPTIPQNTGSSVWLKKGWT